MLTFQKVYTPTPAFLYNDQPLQYNVLGTIIDHKGCFKSGIQELSKKGLKVLFSMRKIFSNFEQLPLNLSCKLFDTLLRYILTYNCEIWYMEDYLIYILVKKRNVTPLSIFITFLIQTIFYDKLLFSSIYVVMNIDMCTKFISVQL
jgi:hypothetical protein